MHITAQPTTDSTSIVLRPATPADEEFLLRLEALLSGHLRNGRGLSVEMARSLARLILRGRESAWRAVWPHTSCIIVECNGTAIGRLWVDTSSATWQLLDLALLPCHRGHGLGREAFRIWLQQADEAGANVQIGVALHDPMLLRLRCLNFVASRKGRGQVLMQRRPVVPAEGWESTAMPLAA